MDGSTFVGGGGSAEIMPDQQDGSGSKISIGSYTRSGGSFSFNIVSTDHDGQWAGIPTKSEYRSFNFDGKAAFGKSKLKGLAIFGLGFSSVKVINGSTDGFNVANAKFKGMDFRLGAGLSFTFTDNLILEFNAVKRIGDYNRVDGIVSGDVSDVDGEGVTTSIELIFVFDD